MRLRHVVAWAMLAVWPAASLGAGDSKLPTADEIKKLVAAGQYKDALQPIYRILQLRGTAAVGYDRCEMLLLRGECQLQIKDAHAALDSLAEARKEALVSGEMDKAVAPLGLTLLIQKSNAYQYKPRNAKEGISILDRALRPAAYGALLADEMPAAKLKVEALNNVKTLGPVLEAAKAAGGVRALEILSKPGAKAASLESAALVSKVTTNADRLLTSAIDDYSKLEAGISTNVNQIVNDFVPMYDPVSKRAWQQPRTRRRGPSDQEVKTLNAIIGSCDKVRDTSADLAGSLLADLNAYQAIASKADAAKAKAVAILNDNYLVVPQ